jgi:hypothetical protein
MHHDGPARLCRPILLTGLLLVLGVSGALAGEWEEIRESYDNALRTHEKRIGEIEAKERGIPNQLQRADKITRDKIASARTSLKGGSRDQGEQLDLVRSEWGAEGGERKKNREAMATTQRNLERANANLTKAAKALARPDPSDALEKAARIEAAVTEAGDRLRARWQLEQAARERETAQREREAAARARGAR